MDYFLKLVHVFVLNRSRKQSSNQMVGSTQQQQDHTQTYHNTHTHKHTQTQTQTQTPTQTHTRTRTREAGRESRQGRRLRTQVENENETAGKIVLCTIFPPERDGSGRVGQGGNRTEYCGNSNSNGHIGGQQQQKAERLKGGGLWAGNVLHRVCLKRCGP